MPRLSHILVSTGVVGILLLFPPWRATIRWLWVSERTLPTITISLPWPNPSFQIEGLAWTARHDFHPLVSVFTPPRPRPETIGRSIVGVWTTSLDVPRLIVMMLAAFLISLGAQLVGQRYLARRARATE